MTDLRELARTMRRIADGYIHDSSDNASEINAILPAIREWAPGLYSVGDVRMDDGVPYRCAQAHDSTSNPEWHPSTVPALWVPYHGTSPETARPFIHPTNASDIYKAGEYCFFNLVLMRAKNDTAYSPDEYVQAWENV